MPRRTKIVATLGPATDPAETMDALIAAGVDVASKNIHEVNREVIEELLRRGTVRDGDLAIITKGDRSGVDRQTNIMKIMRVGEHALLTED